MKLVYKILTPILCLFMLTGCPTSSSNSGSGSSDYSNSMTGMYASEGYFDEDYKEAAASESQYVNMQEYDPETNTFSGKKIIYSGDASLETKNYKDDLKQIEELISSNGVFVDSSSEEDYDNYWYTNHNKYVGTYGKIKTWTLRIPIENFDAFVNSLSLTSAHISSKNIYSNDVTKQYNDNTTQIAALEVQRDRLLELLAQAQNVSEMLEIEDRLTEIRYRLESLNNTNTEIDYDVKYSEFRLTLREVNRYSTDTYSFWERLVDSFGESWTNFFEFLGDSLINLIYITPFIILACLILCIINLIRVKNGKEKISIRKFIKNVWTDSKSGGLFKVLLILCLLFIVFAFIRYVFFW